MWKSWSTDFSLITVLPFVFLESILFAVCIVGDTFQNLTDNRFQKALVDSFIHGSIAYFSWLIISWHGSINWQKCLAQSLLCGCIGCLMDIDHFVAAHSFHLEDALNLPTRPFLHASLITPILAVAVVASFSLSFMLSQLLLICFVAVFSHQTRDAARRGYWLWPAGSTPPLPYWLYIFIIVSLPLVIRMLNYLNLTKAGKASLLGSALTGVSPSVFALLRKLLSNSTKV